VATGDSQRKSIRKVGRRKTNLYVVQSTAPVLREAAILSPQLQTGNPSLS